MIKFLICKSKVFFNKFQTFPKEIKDKTKILTNVILLKWKFLVLYCLTCKKSICNECFSEAHNNHEVEEKADYLMPAKILMERIFANTFIFKSDPKLSNYMSCVSFRSIIKTEIFDKMRQLVGELEAKCLNCLEFFSFHEDSTEKNNDLFFLTFEMIPKYDNKNITELKGLQFVLFSAEKIINEGKISELFSINRINTAFPISNKHIFISIESEIKIIDIFQRKIIKIDKNLELFKFNISFAKYLFNDIVLISSFNDNKSIIYSTDKLGILYFISDKIERVFTLGNNKVVLIGEKIKEMLLLPDMYVLSLSQYETDIFNSIETKSFYPINENTFLFINHKNKKLKEVIINEINELIITKDILCPNEFISFCPFIYTYENVTHLLCSLFICRDQTYQITNYKLENIINPDDDCEKIYFSTKRLFLNFFEINNINNELNDIQCSNPNFNKQIKDFEYIYIPYSIISPTGASTLNFALFKNKRLYELNSFYNYFEPNMKSEIIYNNYSKDIYILSIIKNFYIYIVKLNELESNDVCQNYNFGNIKTKGIVNLRNDNAFIFYDKQAIIINVVDSYKSKINLIDTFLFPFNIISAFFYFSNIILISETKIYLFDYYEKKLKKEMNLDLKIKIEQNIDFAKRHLVDTIYKEAILEGVATTFPQTEDNV